MASRQHPDKAALDGFRLTMAAVTLFVITIISPIVIGHTHGWITVLVVVTGLAALACAFAAGMNTERWRP